MYLACMKKRPNPNVAKGSNDISILPLPLISTPHTQISLFFASFFVEFSSFSILKVDSSVMDKVVDCLENAYQDFVAAAADVLETKASSNGERTAATDAALENFQKKWEAFKVACDQADELVDSVKQSITANTTFPVNENMIDIFDHAVVHYDDD